MSIFSEERFSQTQVGARLRVLQLGKYYYPYMGGIENHLYLLCNELKHDIDLDVIVCNTRRASTTDSVDGVKVRRCFELAKLASASICPTMPLELSRRDYDIVHFHFPHPMGVMSYQLARRPNRHAVVVTYHSDIVRQVKLLKAYRPFMDRLLARADAILCTSPDYMEGSDALRSLRHKCHIVPYGIDTSQFEPSEAIAREARSIRARFGDRPLVLAVGRLIYYKGFEYVIRAMREVDAELAIVGDGPLRSSLEATAREMGIAHRVHFIGEVHNLALAPWYYACNVYALPSIARSEAFAIVQLEAMACGKPIVNTAIPRSGVPFVSRAGESGLTVPPADAQSFGRALRTILADDSLARRLGEAGLRRVKREFSKEAMARRTKEIYRSVTRAPAN
jgi:glycosyltransferase involved in cell wall biosynthesis